MGRMSKRKGARGEYLLAELFRENGFENVRRVGQQQYQRGSEVADVVGLPGCHIECKFVERLDLRRAMEQSQRDAEDEGQGNIPLVCHKQSRRPWLVTLRIEDFIKLYRGWRHGERAVHKA